ncbi:MAG: hypothetical protein KIS94_08835 [Chitinophagales bacterium]|nr:hypothetical protein [Chitinophagales bacterium]
MNKAHLLNLFKELLWVSITMMLVYAILYPVTQKIDYIYYAVNSAFIFVTLTYFRWSVTFKSLPFFRPAWIRFAVFTLNIVMFFYFAQKEQQFLMFYDSFYTEDFGFPKVIMYDEVKDELFAYLRTEIILFGTGSLLMIVALNFRLLISWWQYYKQRANALLEG